LLHFFIPPQDFAQATAWVVVASIDIFPDCSPLIFLKAARAWIPKPGSLDYLNILKTNVYETDQNTVYGIPRSAGVRSGTGSA
jgi:hypothetical protein